MIFRMALKEIIRHKRFNFFYLIHLSLGLIGFISVESVKNSIESYSQSNSKQILSADLSVSARRKISDREIQVVEKIVGTQAEKSEIFEFFAMASSASSSRLVLVKVIDDNYPLYGNMLLASGKKIDSPADKSSLKEKPRAWPYSELQSLMGIQAGDSIQLGKIKFEVSDFITKDSTQTFRLATLAPRLFIHRKYLEDTGLIQFGSTFTQAILFRLPAEVSSDELKNKIYSEITDPSFHVESSKSAGENSARQLTYLSDFLSLSALVALILSCLGAASLFRFSISTKYKEIAIFRTLGLQSSQAIGVYVAQIVILNSLALLPTYLGAQSFLPILAGLLNRFFSVELNFTVPLFPIAFALIVSILSSLLMSWPFLRHIYLLKPGSLLSESKFSIQNEKTSYLYFIPALALFYGLSVYQSNSLKTGSFFFGSILVLSLVVFFVVFIFFRSLSNHKWKFSWPLNLGLKSLVRKRNQSWPVLISISLACLLINLIPQLKSNLRAEFSAGDESHLPSFFLFDIQDDQVDKFSEFLKESNVVLRHLSPMVRARITKVNDKDFERGLENQTFRTREDESEARTRNRGVNISYRSEASADETIVDGDPFPTPSHDAKSGLPLISLEKRYAERMQLKIGDELTFDVQGVEVRAKVHNFRKVNWSSFQPNFFILIQKNVLEDAPKTFIATLPPLENSKKEVLLKNLSLKFPNVSAVDIRRTAENVLQMAEQMSWSLELMSFLTLITGLVILYSIIMTQVSLRRWEINMLKILGSRRQDLTRSLMVEFLSLVLLGGLIGTLLSFVFSGVLLNYLFDTTLTPDLFQSGGILIVIMAVTVGIVWLSIQQIVKEKPLILLREG